MVPSASNDNGRALEFAVTWKLDLDGGKLTSTAQRHQVAYKKYFDALLPRMNTEFTIASERIAKWLNSIFLITGSTVDKSLDSDPGAADLIVTSGSKILKLSLKHNHDALKHQRPHALAQQCGFSRGSAEDLQHRSGMEKIEGIFRQSTVALAKYTDNETAKFKMLEDVCKLSSDSITEWAKNSPNMAGYYFGFLVANDCYQIIVDTNKSLSVEVHDYNSLNMPSSVSTSTNGIYLHMVFDNGFALKARLHTASSTISKAGKQLSLKFDTRKHMGRVPSSRLS
jgi:hypothetical protein